MYMQILKSDGIFKATNKTQIQWQGVSCPISDFKRSGYVHGDRQDIFNIKL
jgi:hypothetical protein